jgi:hypothetical protein
VSDCSKHGVCFAAPCAAYKKRTRGGFPNHAILGDSRGFVIGLLWVFNMWYQRHYWQTSAIYLLQSFFKKSWPVNYWQSEARNFNLDLI